MDVHNLKRFPRGVVEISGSQGLEVWMYSQITENVMPFATAIASARHKNINILRQHIQKSWLVPTFSLVNIIFSSRLI